MKSSMLFRATKHPLPDGLVAKLALDGKTASTPMLMFRCLFCDTKFASTQRRARMEWRRRCDCHLVGLLPSARASLLLTRAPARMRSCLTRLQCTCGRNEKTTHLS